MQTIPTSDGSNITGGIQTPLLTEDQLEPGVFITGNTMQNVWRVERVDLAANIVSITKQPYVAPDMNHTHSFILHQNTTCACGRRNQNIRGEATGLLPLRANTPRTHIIKPREALVMPDRFTVYLDARGQVRTANQLGQWSAVLPLIPALYPVWTLPEALRSRLR